MMTISSVSMKKMSKPLLILPCPYCGKNNQTIVGYIFQKYIFKKRGVLCKDCGAGGPLRSTKKKAIEDYNVVAALVEPWED
jgi:hypothetical protein